MLETYFMIVQFHEIGQGCDHFWTSHECNYTLNKKLQLGEKLPYKSLHRSRKKPSFTNFAKYRRGPNLPRFRTVCLIEAFAAYLAQFHERHQIAVNIWIRKRKKKKKNYNYFWFSWILIWVDDLSPLVRNCLI